MASTNYDMYGAAAAGALDAYMKAKEQEKAAGQSTASLRQRQYENQQNQNFNRGREVQNGPTDDLALAQNQALMGAITPTLRNSNYSRGGPSSGEGGLRLPEQGLGSGVTDLYSDRVTQSALQAKNQNRYNIDPNYNALNTVDLYGASAQPSMMQTLQYKQMKQQQDAAERARSEALVNQAIDKGDSSGWEAFGAAGLGAAMPLLQKYLGGGKNPQEQPQGKQGQNGNQQPGQSNAWQDPQTGEWHYQSEPSNGYNYWEDPNYWSMVGTPTDGYVDPTNGNDPYAGWGQGPIVSPDSGGPSGDAAGYTAPDGTQWSSQQQYEDYWAMIEGWG